MISTRSIECVSPHPLIDPSTPSPSVSKPLLVPREGKFTHDVAMGLGLKTRRVHVCVVAGKHLVSADENGLSDPYVQVALDNSPASVFNSRSNRTKTARRTLNPVWGGGRGETFTFARAPGASEVQLRSGTTTGGYGGRSFSASRRYPCSRRRGTGRGPIT